MRLDELPLRQPAVVSRIAWDELGPAGSKRLRELGFDEGVAVQTLHRAPFGGDPIACRVGRMTIALRVAMASAVEVDATIAAAPAAAAATPTAAGPGA